MTIQLKKQSENQSNGLSEEAQKKLDEFFEILEQENQKKENQKKEKSKKLSNVLAVQAVLSYAVSRI